ncbi:MAG: hypothetical protein B5M51_04255 [Anaerolinea sp. 4484_236]|nr:MAG: hypothetical protein B5M51_04255 [Anaerolinea sp. 4484_236]
MSMPTPNPSQDKTQERRAFIIAIVFLVGIVANLALSLSQAIQTGAWQHFVRAGLVVIFGAATIIAIIWIRRGRVEEGIWLIIRVFLFTLFGTSLLLGGFGLILALFELVLAGSVTAFALPKEKKNRSFITIVIAALLTFGVDLLPFNYRIPAPAAMTTALPIIATLVIITVVTITTRQAWVGGNIRVKLVTSFTLVALIAISILGAIVYNGYQNQIRESIHQRLVNMAGIAALQQNGDLHATLQKPGDEETDAYKEIQATNLAIVATDPEIAYLYTMRMDDQGQVRFFVDAGQPGNDELASLAEVYIDPTPLMLAEFPTLDHAIAEKELATDKWGTWLSGYAPFYNSAGEREGIIGIDISADTVLAQERAILKLIISTAIGTLIGVSLIGLALGTAFTRPIVSLAATAQKVADGDLSARSNVQTSDELGTLASIFDTMTAQLQETLGTLEQRVADRTRALETSTEVSRRLSTILNQEELAKTVVDELVSSFGYYYAHIYRFEGDDKNTLHMKGGTGEAGRILLARGHTIQKGQGLVGRAAERNSVVLVNDTLNEEGWLPNDLLPETRSEIAVPIAIGDEVLGVFDVQHNELNAFSEEDAILLQALANQIAIAAQNAQAYTDSQRRADREALMANIAQEIQSTSTMEDALKVAVRELGRALDTDTSVKLK